MRGDPSDPNDRSKMADERKRGLYWEENVQTSHGPRVADYHTTIYKTPEEAFEAFETLPKTRSDFWNFFVSQAQNGWSHSASHYQSARRNFHKTLPSAYQFCVMEDRRDGTITDFVCDRFPEKQFPVYHFKELYREVVQDLTQLTQFWIDGHDEPTKRRLEQFRRAGNAICLANVRNKTEEAI